MSIIYLPTVRFSEHDVILQNVAMKELREFEYMKKVLIMKIFVNNVPSNCRIFETKGHFAKCGNEGAKRI